jgi:Ca2+-binding EF-hand superfamily protein
MEELQALHTYMGEPLTDEEAAEAFSRIDVDESGWLSFDNFLSWYWRGRALRAREG